MKLFRRLQYIWNRRRLDRELAVEMDFHREMAAKHGGVPFGNALRLREESRDAWGWTWIDDLLHDIRYATRTLRRSPAFTMAAILMLAIGIGANIAVFGFFDLMVLRPMNVKDPATLLRFHRRSTEAYAYALPYPEIAFFRDHSRTLSSVMAVASGRVVVGNDSKQSNVQFVSTDYFSQLGAIPHIGRMFDPNLDGSAKADPVVVLSYGFWQSRYNSDPTVSGKVIRINGNPATIVGVADESFGGLSFDEPVLWAPITQHPYFIAGSHLLTEYDANSGAQLWGRLAPGSTPAAAEAELRALAAELRQAAPTGIWLNETLPSEPGAYAKTLAKNNTRGNGAEDPDRLLQVIVPMAALVMLILGVACANLGSLLLARGVARQREISIRMSIGARTSRIVRQLLTESLLLALMGSALGIVVGYWTLRSLMTLGSAPRWLNATPDWRVIVFAALAAFASAVLFGLTPAWQLARRREQRLAARQILVGCQVAASCVLLIIAGLLTRASAYANRSDPGFNYANVISIQPRLSEHGWSPARARVYLDSLQSGLLQVPGVNSIALAIAPPLGHVHITVGMNADGRPLNAQLNRVTPEYFSTMQIRLLRGRNLDPRSPREAIISDSLARAAWPGRDPIGKKLPLDDGYVIVGVSANARSVNFEDSDAVEVYLPVSDADMPVASVIARTAAAPESVASAIAAAAKSVDPTLFPEMEYAKTNMQQKLHVAEYTAISVGALAAIAHLLACLGLVGIVAYAVSQRTKEIGIQMALGAPPATIIGGILRHFLWPVVGGLFVGVTAGAAGSHVFRSLLYGISNLDPLTYVVTIVVFGVTILVAALLPARRVIKIDPVKALRYE